MRIARLVLAALLATALPLAAGADVAPGYVQPFAKTDMIAAANPLAAEAGLEMLRAGGSAVDAAIAVQMVLGLVEPESSGIGGGAFMLVYNPKDKQTTSFDGREVAPASATPNMFLDAAGKARPKPEAIPGGLSVGIPGVVAMLEMAHQKYGKLPWARLFQPAIKLADGAKTRAHHPGFFTWRKHARHPCPFLSCRRHAAGRRRDL
jgi:gamma-glutamyltranspeptidase / glutathione hydrolase